MITPTEAEAHFLERLCQQAQSEGLSRIAGQISAALIVSDGSDQLVRIGGTAACQQGQCQYEHPPS